MPIPKPRNPRYQDRLRENVARPGFTRMLGTAIEELAPGRAVLQLAYRHDLAQHHGFFHGGVVGALADNACGLAAGTLVDEQTFPITSEYKINLLRPARGDALRATGEVVKPGSTVTVCRAEVIALSPDAERLCAVMLASLVSVPA